MISKKSEIALRDVVKENGEAILQTIFHTTDYGVMLTDLEHTTLALNRRFGEIFQVDIHAVVHSSALDVRKMVAHLIPDLEIWESNLENVYLDPAHTQEDELTLLTTPLTTVRRWTGPVFGSDGKIVGRLWTFQDTTLQKKQREIGRLLYQVSAIFEPESGAVYQQIVDLVAAFYQSNCFLSLAEGDYLRFRAVSSPIPEVQSMVGNWKKDSYCQFVLADQEPILIQDSRLNPGMEQLLPARFGMTRYLGVPIFKNDREVIGTLCILDPHSDQPLEEQDIQFLSMIAMKIGSEIMREEFVKDRIAERERVLQMQAQDLETTRQVLNAITGSFERMIKPQGLDEFLIEEVSGHWGLLGFDRVGIFVSKPQDKMLYGFVKKALHKPVERVALQRRSTLSHIFGKLANLVIPIQTNAETSAQLVLGSQTRLPEPTEFHNAHLDAIVDQLSLSLSTFLLKQELEKTGEELKVTQSQLIQSEKLGAVGTLAASTAHDIKNILATVNMELESRSDDPVRALLAVKNQMDRFSVLAHRLLSYAKPRLVSMSSVDLDTVVHRVIALTEPLCHVSKVGVVCSNLSQLPAIQGDQHQIEHLLVNLVLNSVNAMATKGGNLLIKGSKTKDSVSLTVEDNGKGISELELKTLFQPFRSSRSEGFGLGLYSCKRIVEEHGGSISVQSVSGKGTTISLKFRL